jgi:hypothetical protein
MVSSAVAGEDLKRNLITQIPCALLLILSVLSVAVPGRAQDGKGANQTLQSATQKVITDPAEHAADIAAINTMTSLESRQAALDAFLQRFPNSVMHDELEDSLFETIVRQGCRPAKTCNLSHYSRGTSARSWGSLCSPPTKTGGNSSAAAAAPK